MTNSAAQWLAHNVRRLDDATLRELRAWLRELAATRTRTADALNMVSAEIADRTRAAERAESERPA